MGASTVLNILKFIIIILFVVIFSTFKAVSQESQLLSPIPKDMCDNITLPLSLFTQNYDQKNSSEEWLSQRQKAYTQYNDMMDVLYLRYTVSNKFLVSPIVLSNADTIRVTIENIESQCFKLRLLHFFNYLEATFLSSLKPENLLKQIINALKKIAQQDDLKILYLTEERKKEFLEKNYYLKIDETLLYGYFDKITNTVYIDFYGFSSEKELLKFIFHELYHPLDRFTDKLNNLIILISKNEILGKDFILSKFLAKPAEQKSLNVFLQREFISDKNFNIWLSLMLEDKINEKNMPESVWFNDKINRGYFDYLKEKEEEKKFPFLFDEYKKIIAIVAMIFFQQGKIYLEELRAIKVSCMLSEYFFEIINHSRRSISSPWIGSIIDIQTTMEYGCTTEEAEILRYIKKNYFRRTGISEDPVEIINDRIYEKINTYIRQSHEKINY